MADPVLDGYASALLAVAEAEGGLDRAGDELFAIARSFESSVELREALTDPRLPTARKLAIVSDLIGERASELSVGLVGFVVSMGRADELPAIVDRLVEDIAARRDRAVAEVRSAVELDDETVARLTEALSRATGKRVEVRTVVDPSVIGGLVARIGDTVIDGSVRGRLDSLRDNLQAAAKG